MKDENLIKRKSLKYAFVLRKDLMENPKGKSKTVPGEAVEIRELIRRVENGTMEDIEREVSYSPGEPDHDDIDLSKISDMDIAERYEILQDLGEVVTALREKVEKYKANKDLEKEETGKEVNGLTKESNEPIEPVMT